MSIKFRLMLIFTSIVAVLLSAFSVYIYYSTVFIRKNAYYDRLWERTETMVQLLKISPQADLSNIHPSIRNTYWTILPDEEIIVVDEGGNRSFVNKFLGYTIDYDPIIKVINERGKFEEIIGDRQFVGKKSMVNGRSVIVIVSSFDRNGKRLLARLRLTISSSFFVAILVIVLAGWFFSRNIFKPVEKIIDTAKRISDTDLHLRVPVPAGRNELARLVHTINESFDRLQKAFEVQKSFVLHASHELRTPLTALRGELEVALLKKRTLEEYEHFISIAYEDANRMSNLVNHLLLFAQTSGDKRAFNFISVRIDELIMDVMQKMTSVYEGCHIELNFKEQIVDENSLIINGHEPLLSIAFSNLIDNALKFSGNKPVHIGISAGEKLKVSIADQGRGILTEDMEKVFEPFYRSGDVSSIPGFGIGLPMTRQILELHGALIEIHSISGRGTTIVVTFFSPK
jgi:signal transduction histidine kinase